MIHYWRETWAARLHFSLLLLVFGELVAWQDATRYSALDWAAVALIYVALGAILLDLIHRFHAHELKSLLLVGGIFGLVQGTLISLAAVGREDWLVNLLLRALGAEVLMFLLAYTLFWRGGKSLGYGGWLGALVLGLGWGVWTRWFPQLESVNVATPSWDESLPYVVIMLALGVLFPLFLRPAHEIEARLTPYEGAAAGGVLVVALILRGNGGYLPTFNLGVVALLLLMCGVLLAFSRILRQAQPFTPHPPLLAWLLLLVPFALAAWVAYNLSDTASEPWGAALVFRGLLLFGGGWLPLVSTWIGMAIFVRLTREGY